MRTSAITLLLSCMWGILVYYLVRFIYPLFAPARTGQVQFRNRRDDDLQGIMGATIRIAAQIAPMFTPMVRHKKRVHLDARLRRGALPISAEEFLALRFVMALGFVILGTAIDFLARISPMATLVLGILGFLYPAIVLRQRIARREQQISRDFPDLLDILQLAVAAGLDLTSAFRVVVDNASHGPLGEEFSQVERDIVLGKTRADALQGMAERAMMDEVTSFVLAIRQAEQLGASVGPILAVQSEMARAHRWQLAEIIVGKLPMKLVAPLVICIFPASFIVLFTPLIIDFITSGF
ncbi:MAG: type II secretion system F family protein [Deltaproteobacteria bacterium]|nr:type II secretion system F family protein [Deltaproteobacteria bacterium]